MTARVSRVPCVLYATWTPHLIMRRRWTDVDVPSGTEPPGDRAGPA